MTIYACLKQEAVVVLEGYLSIVYVQGEQREHPNPTNHEWTSGHVLSGVVYSHKPHHCR